MRAKRRTPPIAIPVIAPLSRLESLAPARGAVEAGELAVGVFVVLTKFETESPRKSFENPSSLRQTTKQIPSL